MTNTGNRNTGDRNTGNGNTGYRNTGHRNTGDRNTGDGNTGYLNTGYRNTGSRNTGDRNSANYCVGAFNTKPQKMVLFNKELDMTVEEFYNKYNIYADVKLTEWVLEADMTVEEKEANPTYNTTGGYLKKRDFKEACRLWWSEADEEEKNRFLNLPGFDAEIFEEITGIDIEEKAEEMTLAEVCKELGRNIEIIKE